MTDETKYVVPKCYYFGCESKEHIGHFLFAPRRSNSWRGDDLPFDYKNLDQFLRGDRPQSEVATMYIAGWTVILFNDNTGDSRPGSNSALIAEGRRTFKEMVMIFGLEFPAQLQRIEKCKALYEK